MGVSVPGGGGYTTTATVYGEGEGGDTHNDTRCTGVISIIL